MSINRIQNGQPLPPLAWGAADISAELVQSAIDSLFKRVTPAFQELIKEAAKTDSNSQPKILAKQIDHGSVELYDVDPLNSEIKIQHLRCYIRLNVHLNTFRLYIRPNSTEQGDGLDILIRKLVNRIDELDETILNQRDGMVDVHFEKGFLPEKPSNAWHFDQGFGASLSFCYSNREDWSTRIVDVEKLNCFYSKEELKVDTKLYNISTNKEFREHVEAHAAPAQIGYFYDTLQVYHRAPLSSDFGDNKLEANHQRLFLRYAITSSGLT